MLNVSGTTRVLVATTPVDLRGSFNRLYGLVVDQLCNGRSTLWKLIFIHEPAAQPDQDFSLGRLGHLDLRKKVRVWPVHDSGEPTGADKFAWRRFQCVDSRAGSAVEKRLVSTLIKISTEFEQKFYARVREP